MSDRTPKEEVEQAALLSAGLRGIRQARRLRASEVAQSMGMPLRTYQHFEEGKGALDFEKLKRFADATDSDPFAIVASIWMKSPEFAIRTADNKPLVVLMLALREFHEELGEDIGFIEPRVFWGGFRRVFQDLTEHVRSRDITAETWLDEKARSLGLPVSFGRKSGPRRRR